MSQTSASIGATTLSSVGRGLTEVIDSMQYTPIAPQILLVISANQIDDLRLLVVRYVWLLQSSMLNILDNAKIE